MTVINGIDLDGLGSMVEEVAYPDEVPGRTVHIDADFLAYQCSYEREGEDKSLEDMLHNVDVATEHLRRLAAAERAIMHLTPNGSNKGGRYDIALQKEYQGNRKDEEKKPRYLHVIREFMHKDRGALMHMDCEADDGMSIAQYKAIASGNAHLSIIASKDKDLGMVPGLHLEWDTGSIVNADTFGSIWIDEKGKLRGLGQKFFWAQMLMGDTADNIQGLPKVPASVMNKISPTKAVTAALETLRDPSASPAKREKAQATLLDRKPGACGPATAFKILENINDHRSAFSVVKALYEQCSKIHTFLDYRTGKPVKWQDVFKSEAMLLWMRRDNDNDDVFNWMREVCIA